MFYAFLDKSYRLNFMNSAASFKLRNGWSEPRYFLKPWREGVVYVLSKEGFALEPPNEVVVGFTVQDPHWVN